MKENSKPSTLKRILAYIIDLFVIMLLTEIASKMLLNLDNYYEKNNELVDLMKKATSGEITSEDYTKQYDVLHYEISKTGVKVNVVSCVVITVYFVVLCYFCKGITVGKYIMKLRIVSNNDKELTIFHYLSRSLITNMLLSNILTVIMVKFLTQSQFIKYDSYVQNGISFAIIISFILIMYRNDGRGLEDFMGNTRVIDIKKMNKEKVNDEEKEEQIKEAVIVEKTKKSKKRKDVK